jgi:hypothetical protein
MESGTPGYAELLEVLADPGREDHDRFRSWWAERSSRRSSISGGQRPFCGQRAASNGNEDWHNASTHERSNHADAVLAANLTTPADFAATVDELYAFAAADGTVLSLPRIVQAWPATDLRPMHRGGSWRRPPPLADQPTCMRSTRLPSMSVK